MELKTNSSEALNTWLSGSFHTEHVLDMNRFYNFVTEYQREHGYEIDEPALREEIENRISKYGGSVSEDLRDIINDRISLAYNILDFLKQTGR